MKIMSYSYPGKCKKKTETKLEQILYELYTHKCTDNKNYLKTF